MDRMSLKERIKQGLFLLDGAMGTELIARGIEAGVCNDYLNVESPDIVLDVHRAYLEAGSDAVIANTFGANKYALARHDLGDKVKEINATAAQIGRRAAGEEKYVLGDIGPSGDFLEPLGSLKPGELKDAFAEQAEALLAGGVDGFIIETMTALDEIEIAIEAVKSVSGDLPVFASMSFDRAGDDGTVSLDEYIELAGKYVAAVKALGKDVLIYAEPNAGKPELVDDKAVYKVSPEDFAAAVEKIHSAGINIIGGCCGTGPGHIEAVARRLK
jgi:5-methyltetrahydrofolate--homocysteine methyltransferase